MAGIHLLTRAGQTASERHETRMPEVPERIKVHRAGPAGGTEIRRMPLVPARYRGTERGELDIMGLSKEQEDTVRLQVIEMWGEECVKNIDRLFFEFHDIRAASMDNYTFLKTVRDKHGEIGDQVVAALPYGMKMGELGREYAYRQERQQELEQTPIGYS